MTTERTNGAVSAVAQPAQSAANALSVLAPVVALPPVTVPPDLLYMLQYRRPASSDTERDFIRRYLKPLGVERDKRGNIYKRVGNAPTVLWSAHTDTVHRSGGLQRLLLRKSGAEIALADEKASDCLGADNTAGVWLLCEMVRAGVPGLYVWHRAEERGRLGSQWIAQNTPALVTGLKAAIAFDRRYESSVITKQMGKRCCSDAFAESLIALLALGHRTDPTGSYTDTASYTGLIGECTNVSAGFAGEHTERETLNTRYLLALRDKLVTLDATALATLADVRKPGEVEPISYYGEYGGYGEYSGRAYDPAYWEKCRERWAAEDKRRSYVNWWHDALWVRDGKPHAGTAKRMPHAWNGHGSNSGKRGAAVQSARSFRTIRDEIEANGPRGHTAAQRQRLVGWDGFEGDEGDEGDAWAGRVADVVDVLRRYPASVADWLEEQGVTADELLACVARHKLVNR